MISLNKQYMIQSKTILTVCGLYLKWVYKFQMLKNVQQITMSEACVHCLQPVEETDEAVSCDGCERWQHRACETGIFIS